MRTFLVLTNVTLLSGAIYFCDFWTLKTFLTWRFSNRVLRSAMRRTGSPDEALGPEVLPAAQAQAASSGRRRRHRRSKRRRSKGKKIVTIVDLRTVFSL